jgi:hypothetical protein
MRYVYPFGAKQGDIRLHEAPYMVYGEYKALDVRPPAQNAAPQSGLLPIRSPCLD